jgi:hypothetical protein
MLRRHRAAHVRIWQALAILLPALLILAAALRPTMPVDHPPVRLDAPAGGGP